VKKSFVLLTSLVAGTVLASGFAIAQDSTKTKVTKTDTTAIVSYSKAVDPFLQKYCVTCHNSDDTHPSELYMDTYELLMKGGKHGKAVIPGNAKESLLYQKTGSEPPFGKIMPPPKKKERPTPEQLEMLRLWINQGAKKN
jgi:hypothetical protein